MYSIPFFAGNITVFSKYFVLNKKLGEKVDLNISNAPEYKYF